MDEEHAVFASWGHDDEETFLSLKLPTNVHQYSTLRFDPIASKGVFGISSMRILDAEQNVLVDYSCAVEVDKASTLRNVRFLSDDNNESFIALNNDPHLLFDFSEILAKTNTVKLKPDTLEVKLSLLHGDWYEPCLAVMTQTVNQQNNALVRQANALDEYRAELDYTNLLLKNVVAHRTDLSEMNNALRRDIAQRNHATHELNLKLTHLNDQLVAQLGRNQEMEGYLMMRPSTRLKRFLKRSINRLRGKTEVVSHSVDHQNTDDLDQERLNGVSEVDGLIDNAVETDTDSGADSSLDNKSAVDEFPSSGELLGQNTEDYQLWVSENTLNDAEIELAKSEIESMEFKPTFSVVVPVYNVDVEYLIAMIRSVQAQIYPYWQLCIVDDASPKSYLRQVLEHEAAQDSRISIQLNDVNQGISLATNDAVAMANGDYIGLLDHDDELSVDALYENAKAINAQQDVGLIYSDEDKMDMQGNRLEPFFKPDYSPDLLDTNNYICHFTVIKKAIVDEIGGFREGLDGSQDHDIILRAIAKAERVVHIPKVLYHWRKIPGSTAVVYDSKSYAWEAGRKAVESCLNQHESGVHVEFGTLKGTYRVFRNIQGNPLVSIIIPFKDKPELLDACLDSILARTTYTNFEILGVSNNSEEPETFSRMEHYAKNDSRIRFVEKNVPFNFSAICNYGATQATGNYLLFLNNDIEIISPDWIERLLEYAQRPQTGAVGGKLLYPDGRIQHAGVVAGMIGLAGHPHKFFPENHIGYHGRLHMAHNVSAVTGAMLMVAEDKFKQTGGFDEEHLAVAYNDVDLCLSLMELGYLNVFTPHCKAIHHESISRGYEDTQEKLNRLKKEQVYFLNKWSSFLAKGDPFYNPNLSLKNERFSLNFND
jgi:glycosyltransferase involved in cell wall biosynthesis